ncbi:Uncharacterized protein Fot_56416 [Forsythia ovata]|uniref:Uncharacterized protein n=1 Tax=Forsythia ovata TaxID=205694 RepID=A0ABD1P031_9LAMI
MPDASNNLARTKTGKQQRLLCSSLSTRGDKAVGLQEHEIALTNILEKLQTMQMFSLHFVDFLIFEFPKLWGNGQFSDSSGGQLSSAHLSGSYTGSEHQKLTELFWIHQMNCFLLVIVDFIVWMMKISQWRILIVMILCTLHAPPRNIMYETKRVKITVIRKELLHNIPQRGEAFQVVTMREINPRSCKRQVLHEKTSRIYGVDEENERIENMNDDANGEDDFKERASGKRQDLPNCTNSMQAHTHKDFERSDRINSLHSKGQLWAWTER